MNLHSHRHSRHKCAIHFSKTDPRFHPFPWLTSLHELVISSPFPLLSVDSLKHPFVPSPFWFRKSASSSLTPSHRGNEFQSASFEFIRVTTVRFIEYRRDDSFDTDVWVHPTACVLLKSAAFFVFLAPRSTKLRTPRRLKRNWNSNEPDVPAIWCTWSIISYPHTSVRLHAPGSRVREKIIHARTNVCVNIFLCDSKEDKLVLTRDCTAR